MVETSTLLSLLQFVALAAPAIAILLQVVEDMRGGEIVFHLLISSLVLIVLGGILISYQLITVIEEVTVLSSVILIFGSLIVLASALSFTTVLTAWRSRPEADMADLRTYSLDLFRTAGNVLFACGTGAMVFGLASLLPSQFYNQNLNFGVLTSIPVSPSTIFIIIALLLWIQSILRLIENGKLPDESFSETANATLVIVLTWAVGFTLFVGPFFIIAYFLVRFEFWFLPLSPANLVLNFPYLWAGFVALILFSVDVDLDDN